MSTEKKDPFDGEYVGSVFGPTLTRYALIVMVLTALLVFGRQYYLDVPLGFEDPTPPSMMVDTVTVDSL